MRFAYLVLVVLFAFLCGIVFTGTGHSVTGEIALLSPEHPTGGEHSSQAEGSATKEHPEHPADSEHPEHPASEEGSVMKELPVAVPKPVTIETVALYLEGYAARQAAEQGGWMKVRDDEKDKTLDLKLDKIHRERLAKTDAGTYFVCADFKTPEGKLYDLDFWVKETDEGLEVTETTVHKEEGKPRYNWVEKDGIWSRKPLNN